MTTTPACNLEKLLMTINGKKAGMLVTNEVYRARVPGGWLVLAGNNLVIGGATFIPDAKHQWKGDSLPG